MDLTEFCMASVRIRWEAIDAMRALNLPEPKKPAEIVRLDQYRRDRWLAKYARPFPKQPNPPSAA